MSKAISRTVGIVIAIVVIVIIVGGAAAFLATNTGTTFSTTTTSTTVQSTTSSSSSVSSSSSSSTTTSTSTSSSTSTSTTTSTTGTGPQFGGTLTIDVSTDKGAPGDPMTVQEGPITGTVQQEVYEGLTAIGFDGSVKPDLATNWTIVSPADFVFNLRQNVTFQDATQFNASAVKFSFDRILNNTGSVRYGQVSVIANVTVKANYQVEFKLHNASADFLQSLAIGEGIVSPTAVMKYGSQYGSQYAVGTGPYKFVAWVQNDHVTLQANPTYWGRKAYIQTIIVKVVPDPTVRALQLQSGAASIVELNADGAQSLKSISGVNVLVGKPNEFITISIDVDSNYTISPLLNPMVRQAINYAINRTAIVQDIELGYAQPGIGPIPPSVLNAWNASLQIYPFGGNKTQAKALLTAAGYGSGFSVEILTGPFTPDFLQVTESVQSDLQAVGINAQITPESFAAEAGTLLSGNGTWSMAFHDWGGIGLPDAFGFMGEFYNANNIGFFQWNLQHIRDANLTNMLSQLGIASNATQEKQLSDQIQTRIMQQGYGAILYYPDVLQGSLTSVQNYTIHPNPWYGYVIFNPVIGAAVWLSTSSSSSVILIPLSSYAMTTLLSFAIVAVVVRGKVITFSARRMPGAF